ncbi:MAG: hypothetical protein J0653_00920, partial [Deltaproteobacteria bacterium]|nr:hypothetical protein [Deltaproteobacteria bacterium]
MLDLSIANLSDVAATNVTVTISTTSPNITFTDNTEFYGIIAVNQIKEIVGAYAFDVAADIPGGELIQFVLSATDGTESWESSFTAVAEGVDLVIGDFDIADYSGNNNYKLDPGETVDILIQTSNNGQLDAADALGTLTSTSPFVTLNNTEYPFGSIPSGQTLVALFSLTVSADAPIGSVVELNYNVTSGGYSVSEQYFRAIGLIIEDFETGDFSLYDWQTAGVQSWTVTGSEKYEGDFSAKSGAIGNGEISEMSLSLVIAGDDSIAYFRKVSSQPNADYFRFYVDEVLWDEASGETGWIRAAAPVSEGLHTFRWVYSKNQNTNAGSDCAWIDYIDLPPSVGMLIANAGIDASVCEAVAFQTVATAENFNTVLWETSGNGVFDDPNTLNAIYTPGTEDLVSGWVTLSLTADGPAQQTVTDDLQLTINPLPAQAAAINGQNIVCMDGENVYTTEIITFADSYVWSLSPAEAGTISVNGTEVSIQWATSWTGMASVGVQGMNNCGVGGPSELFPVQVDDCTGIDDLAGTAFTISPNPGNGLIQLNFAEAIGKPITVRIVNLTGEKVFE